MKVVKLGSNTTEIVASSGAANSDLDRAQIDPGSVSSIMALLANIYTKPVHANVREYVANGYDAHKEAGKVQSVRIHLPNANRVGESFFAVRDFGKGLTPTDISAVFKNYGTSTKRDSNNLIGGFGIGSKSAFALGVDGFQIRSVTLEGGVKTIYTYNYFKDESGIPSLELLASETTDEPTGLEIIIPVDGSNAGSFIEAAYAYLPYFDPMPIVSNADGVGFRPDYCKQYTAGIYFNVDEADLTSSPIIKVMAEDPHNNMSRRNFNLGTHSKYLVLLGNVPYPIDYNQVAKMLDTRLQLKTEWNSIIQFFSHGVDIYAKIGTVEIAPTREALTYTVANCIKILDLFRAAKALVKSKLDAELDSGEDDPASLRYALKKYELYSRFNNETSVDVKPTNVSVNKISFNRSMAAESKPLLTNSTDFGSLIAVSLIKNFNTRGTSNPVMLALEPTGSQIPGYLLNKAVRRLLKIYDRNYPAYGLPSTYFKSTFPQWTSLRSSFFQHHWSNAYSSSTCPIVLVFKEETDLYNELVALANEINDGTRAGTLSNLQVFLDDPSLLSAEDDVRDETPISTADLAERLAQEEAYAKAVKELKKKRARLKVLGLDNSNFFEQAYHRTPTDSWKEVEVDSSMKGYYVPIFRGNVETTNNYIHPVDVGRELAALARYAGLTQEECATINLYGIKKAECPKVHKKFPQLRPLEALFNDLFKKCIAKTLGAVNEGEPHALADLLSVAHNLVTSTKATVSSSLKASHATFAAHARSYGRLYTSVENLIAIRNKLKDRVVSRPEYKDLDDAIKSSDSSSFNTFMNLPNLSYTLESYHAPLPSLIRKLLDNSVAEVANITIDSTQEAEIIKLIDSSADVMKSLLDEYRFLNWEIRATQDSGHYSDYTPHLAIVFNRCLMQDQFYDKLSLLQTS